MKKLLPILALVLLKGCSPCPAAETNRVVICKASWEQFDEAGHIGANRKPFNPAAMTCATRLFPLGTKLVVQDVHNGSIVTVTVTDRTPKRNADRIDLSPAAFQRLNGLALGTCEVKAEIKK